jgi:transcriptional regulator with XRE-family HTH domain
MRLEKDWTERNIENFVSRIRFDFITQLQKKMELMPISQSELAQKMDLTEGRVSQILNNSGNLTLQSIVRYSRALGLKVSIVAYDDNDPDNQHGLVNSEIFATCWEKEGKPASVWDLQENESRGDESPRLYFTQQNTSSTVNMAERPNTVVYMDEYKAKAVNTNAVFTKASNTTAWQSLAS